MQSQILLPRTISTCRYRDPPSLPTTSGSSPPPGGSECTTMPTQPGASALTFEVARSLCYFSLFLFAGHPWSAGQQHAEPPGDQEVRERQEGGCRDLRREDTARGRGFPFRVPQGQQHRAAGRCCSRKLPSSQVPYGLTPTRKMIEEASQVAIVQAEEQERQVLAADRRFALVSTTSSIPDAHQIFSAHNQSSCLGGSTALSMIAVDTADKLLQIP